MKYIYKNTVQYKVWLLFALCDDDDTNLIPNIRIDNNN